MSIEILVRYKSFNSNSRVIHFGDGLDSDIVDLYNEGTTDAISWDIFGEGSSPADAHSSYSYSYSYADDGHDDDDSTFETGEWTHLVLTVAGTSMKMYKNGFLVADTMEGQEPRVLTRADHWLGRSADPLDGYLNGTIAYLSLNMPFDNSSLARAGLVFSD